MPIYEYQCRQCGHQDSDINSASSPRVKKCPQCGKRAFARLISASAFHLKGGGWYATDFKDKPKPPAKDGGGEDKSAADGKGKAKGEAKDGGGGDSAKPADAKKSADSKSAKPKK